MQYVTGDKEYFKGIHLTFLDPPFNQGKQYNSHMDNMPEKEYWNWNAIICGQKDILPRSCFL